MINSIFPRHIEIFKESHSSGTQTLHTLNKKSYVVVEWLDVADGASENSSVEIYIGAGGSTVSQFLATFNSAAGEPVGEHSPEARVYPSVFPSGTVIKRNGIRHKINLHIFELE